MIPVALSRICRSARAMGPCGSSTPSLQPPRVVAPIRATASKPYRMLDLARAEIDGNACAADGARHEFGARRRAGTGIMRSHGTAAVIDQKRSKQHEQVEDGEGEQ